MSLSMCLRVLEVREDLDVSDVIVFILAYVFPTSEILKICLAFGAV